jgi:hypothetical protein
MPLRTRGQSNDSQAFQHGYAIGIAINLPTPFFDRIKIIFGARVLLD